MKLNLKLKKIISYMLVFAIIFTSVNLGNLKIAIAAEQSQVEGLKFHIGEADGRVVPVDRDSSGNYVLDYLPMGTKFTLTSEPGYNIRSVTSSSSRMTIRRTVSANKNIFAISSITDYSDFILTVVMENDNGVTETYRINMIFESDAVLEFSRMTVTIDSDDPVVFNFGETDANGNYVLPDIESSARKARIELYNGNNAMNFKINGNSSKTVNLVGGENRLEITVTNLGISKVYTLIITKDGDPSLRSLKPSKGTLSPAFDSQIFEYEVQVPTTQQTISFTPVAVDSSSSIKVKNSVVNSGSKSPEISLNEGDNKIKITVTTASGAKNVYEVNVIRARRPNSANLKAIKLSKGSISPKFNAEIFDYSATVENNVTSITVTPTAEYATSTIRVNDKKIPSGAESQSISLDEGGNTITITVTDDRDEDTNTYVINVNRKYGKDNVRLSELKVTNGTLSPIFDPEIYNYSVKVPRSVEKVRVIFTAENDKATIHIGDKKYNSGQQSDYINLKLGANNITVQVIAEDKKTTTNYKLSIVRGTISGYNDWILQDGEWTFFDANGIQAKNRWIIYENRWYHLDVNGYMDTGWLYEGNNWYYLEPSGAMKTGWYYEKGYWYYLQGDGAMKRSSWGQYDGKWYYFNANGLMQVGWILYYDKWYYLGEDGAMKKGWVYYDKNMYYLNDDGSMRNGWLKYDNHWYYLDDHGVMQRGWKTIDGKKYYFDSSGAMKTGTVVIDGKIYNLDAL